MVVISKLVDLADINNVRHWCQRWNVSEGQLRIAVARVGQQPEKVRAEILGLRTHAPGSSECFGRVRARPDPRIIPILTAPVSLLGLEAAG